MVNIRTASTQTIRSYRVDLEQFLGPVGSSLPTVEEILQGSPPKTQGGQLCEALLNRQCREAQMGWANLSPASRNRKAATLKSFLGWLHDEGVIERDLASQIHAPKVPVRLPHHISPDEAVALLKSLGERAAKAVGERAYPAHRNQILILLLYGGGLRVSEACGLEWARVSEDARTARIRGKGAQERIVAFPDRVANALRVFRRLLPQGRFIFGPAPLHTRTAYEIVRAAGAGAGLLKPLHPHALRHSFATHLLTSGANLRTLQELLGHRTLQATQRYTHLGIDQLARTLEDRHPLGGGRAKTRGKSRAKAEREKS